MSTTLPTTAEQLAELSVPGQRCELVRGELRMMSPAGGSHGRIAMRIGSMLEQFARTAAIGEVFAAETGFLLAQDPDTVRAPDAAFVRKERYETVKDVTGFVPLAPDLVVEVVSPNDKSSEVEEKANSWLSFGVEIVLVVDPANQHIRVYRDGHTIQVLQGAELVELDPVVPKWQFQVSEVFA